MPGRLLSWAIAGTVVCGLSSAMASSTNLVRLSGRSLCDESGPFLGLGASYFQALRHAKYDRPRLNSNLAFIASRGFNYVRVLSMVNWDGLEIAPVTFTNRAGCHVEAWPDYWQNFRDLLDAVVRHGLRAEVTVFADPQYVMPGLATTNAALKAGDRCVLPRGPGAYILKGTLKGA